MKRALLLLVLAAAPASAELSERDLATAVARPPAGARLPNVTFTGENGRPVTLPQLAAGKPLALLFADYTCPHVCGPGLVLTARALRDSGARDYRFAVIGLDPRDTAADAARFAGSVTPRPILLRGDQAGIDQAARALGYGYRKDPAADQFAHDASLYVFDADGRLAALLPELALRPPALRAALAGAARPEPLTSRVARLCYGLAAAHGRYGRAAFLALQVATALLVAGVALFLWRRRAA